MALPSPPPFFFPDVPDIPLPDGHRFPASKYRLLLAAVRSGGLLGRSMLLPSPPVVPLDLCVAHDPAYVDAMCAGAMTPDAMRRIGLPWSARLVARSLATVGGTLAAARAALNGGISGQLAGGTHHAHRAFGSGFCVFNDLAVAALMLLNEGQVAKVAIVDLDVHQGDGNSAILADDPRVFILSIQGAKNFPFRRVPSTLDVELPDGTGDEAYLAALDAALPAVAAFRPDLVFYLSGADPLRQDSLGRLDLSADGLMARDRRVLSMFARRGTPVAIVIGGGYAQPIDLTVAVYANTFQVAADVHGL